jgi:hypothetical protein
MIKSHVTALLLLTSIPVFAGDASKSVIEGQTTASDQPSDLTLSNFFTAGWDDAYQKRVTPDGAPDMALLHVQTNFLEREFRFDSYSQQNVSGNKTRTVDFMDALIAYSINRRFMIEVVGNYEWMNAREGNDSSGGAAALLTRLQLVDVPGTSYALNFRVSSPNDGIDVKQTIFSPSLAGWNDLTRFGLKKVGIYYDLQEETYAGPAKAGSKHNDLVYAASLAKTWTEPTTPVFGNFTTFVEFYGTTNLDGDESGNTAVDVTPGIRFTLGHGNVIMAGVDFPISSPHNFDTTYRLTYIINF